VHQKIVSFRINNIDGVFTICRLKNHLFKIMNPNYLAFALVMGAALVSTSSALAATQNNEPIKSAPRAEVRINDAERPFMGTISSVSGTTVLVSAKVGSSPMLSTYTVDASTAKIFRVGKPTTAEGQPVETALTLSALKSGEQVSIKGTKDDGARTITATEIRVGEIARALGRDGENASSTIKEGNRPTTTPDMNRRGDEASSTPRFEDRASSTRPFASSTRPVRNWASTTDNGNGQGGQPAHRGFWSRFMGFFGF